MRKGVTCHKTENSFVMRFTKEVWLACSADGDGLFAKGLHQQKANSKRNGNFVASTKNGMKKDTAKHTSSWSVNTDDHLLMPNIIAGQNQEESCTKFLMDTFNGKVKRHRKSHIAKKSLKKRAISCQDYDMSTIEGIFANDSTIDYDSDKTVDLSLSQSNKKSEDESIINSFKNMFPTLPEKYIQPTFSNVIFKSNAYPRLDDLAPDCISDVSPVSDDHNNNISCQDLSTSDLPKFEFLPSVSSVFNLNINECRPRTPNLPVTISNSCSVDCKSPTHASPSLDNLQSSKTLSDMPEDIYILKGPSTYNCTDLLDSTNSSLSTIDFYTNHPRLTPLNSPSETDESGVQSVEKNRGNNGSINLFSNVNMINDLHEEEQPVTEVPNSFKINNACNDLSVVNFNRIIAEHVENFEHFEKIDPRDNAEVFVNKLSSDRATPFCDKSDSEKKVTSTKSSHPQRRGRKAKRRGFTKIGRRKNLKNLRESLKVQSGADLTQPEVSAKATQPEVRESTEAALQEDTDTDTIPLDLETMQADSPADSRICTLSPRADDILNVDADSNVIGNLWEELNSTVPTSDVADSTVADVADPTVADVADPTVADVITTTASSGLNVNSDFTALRTPVGGECLEEELQHPSTDQSKLEDAGDDSSDDLEIIDLEDIQVNDVITVNFSDLGKVEMLQGDVPQNLNHESCEEGVTECEKSEESLDICCVEDSKTDEEKMFVFTNLRNDEIKDSELIIDLGDPVKNDDCACESTQESIKIKNTENEELDSLLNVKPDVKYFGDPCQIDLCQDRAVVDMKDSLKGRKWERANIFENLTAKVNLSLNNENISVTSNFVVDSFAQKLILELTGTRTVSDKDDIKLEAKNSFSIENIKKVSHKCARIDSREGLYPLEKTSPITIDSDEHIPPDRFNESGDDTCTAADPSFNSKALKESLIKLTEVAILDKVFDEALKFTATIEPDAGITSLKTTDSGHHDVSYLENDVQKSPEPSKQKSLEKFPNRFKKRKRRLSRKPRSSNAQKAKSKIPPKLSAELETGAETEPSKVAEDTQLNLSNLPSEADLPAEVTCPEQSKDCAIDTHTSEFVITASTSEDSSFLLSASGIESSPNDSNESSDSLTPSLGSRLDSSVDVRRGVHLNSSFQPLVNIIPLPLESLTRLAMKTVLACDQLRDDNMFEGEDEIACSSFAFLEAEQVPSIAELGLPALEAGESGESTNSGKCRKNTAREDEGSTARIKKASFLEALNESQCHQHKFAPKRSRKIPKDVKKSLGDDVEKASKNDNNTSKDGTKKSVALSIGRRKINPGKSRINPKRTPSIERSVLMPSKRTFSENILTGMDSILPMMDRTSVMSLPKIRKLSEASTGGPSAQRSCESYGVLEKIEKVMTGDEGLKKFATQNKLMCPSNKPHASTSGTPANQKPSEAAHQFANQTRSSLSIMSDKGTPLFDRKLFRKAFRISNLQDDPVDDVDKCSNMKVGINLPWMRKNRAHDPLGLDDDDDDDDDEDDDDDDKCVVEIEDTCEETKNEFVVLEDSRVERIQNRINFVKPAKSCLPAEDSEGELTIRESRLLSKFRDEMQDLEVIIKVHRGMINQGMTQTSHNRNQYRYGDSYNDNYRRPYWRRNFYGSEERDRPHHYDNSRRYYNNRYENRWSTKCYYPGRRDYSTNQSSKFPKNNSNFEVDYEQSNAYAEESNRSKIYKTGSEDYAEESNRSKIYKTESEDYAEESNRSKIYKTGSEDYAEKSYDDNDRFGQNSFRRQYRNSFQQQQQQQQQNQRWNSKRFPWHNTRRFYKRKFDDKEESETMEKCGEGASPESRPYNRDYYYSYCRAQAPHPYHKNKFFDDSEEHREADERMFQVKSLVKSKVSVYLEGSLVPSENYATIVDDIMRKLMATKHKILTGRAEDENEEGECDDSEPEDESSMDLDCVINQYLKEFGSYYVAAQSLHR